MPIYLHIYTLGPYSGLLTPNVGLQPAAPHNVPHNAPHNAPHNVHTTSTQRPHNVYTTIHDAMSDISPASAH